MIGQLWRFARRSPFFLTNILPFKPGGLDPLMWSLVVCCVEVLNAESHRRRRLLLNLDQAAELGEEISIIRVRRGGIRIRRGEIRVRRGNIRVRRGNIRVRHGDIELADDIVLRTFKKNIEGLYRTYYHAAVVGASVCHSALAHESL